MASRQAIAGFPIRAPRSRFTFARFQPTTGFVETPDVFAPLDSIVSGQNIVIRQGRMEPRPRLQQIGTNLPTPDVPNGALTYNDVGGARHAVVTSQDTVSFLDGDSWTQLTYVSGTSNLPPSGGERDLFFGDSVYLERSDVNILVLANGVDPLFAWAGPSSGTALSTLTQAPIAKDVTLFDNRPVAWNIRELSTSSQLVQRVQWSVRGDPENWTSLLDFAGSEDLLDMRGEGTRIFSTEDQMVLFSTEEIWRGRKIGPPFVFQFTPLNREVGAPHARAVIQTEDGIFWLNRDFMVYRLVGNRVEPVGRGIQRTLRNELLSPELAFFSYDASLRHLTLHYTTISGSATTAALTLSTGEGHWTPHVFTHGLTMGFEAPLSSSASTWDGMPATLDDHDESYNELLGQTGARNAAVTASNGTVYGLTTSAISDDGAAVLSQAQLGGFFTDTPNRTKYADEVRLDVRAGSASSMSVAISGDLGATLSENQIAIPAQSNTTQVKTNFGVSGTYFTMRVRTDSTTTWELNGVTARARLLGESV